MDLIPVITEIFIYFVFALVLVLLFSYFFSKTLNKNEQVSTSSIEEQRKHIRQYIIKQNQYLSTKTPSRKTLNPHFYSAPTYTTSIYSSKKKTRGSAIVSKELNGKLSKTGTNGSGKRYSIVNDNYLGKGPTIYIDPNSKSYTSVKELRSYQY